MANIKISELTELTQKANNDYVPIVDTSADETKKISVKDLIPSNVTLLAVSSVEPEECYTGDKYFDTTDNLIYTAIERNVWSTTGEQAQMGINYIVFDTQTAYAYDGTTLVSVGGGSGGETLPVGTVLEFPTTDSTKVPDGWLFCDGSAVSRTTYADLFAIIGTSFGAGDGSTTFNLPTKEGLVSVGIKSSDTDFNTIGKTGGSKDAVLVEHTHNNDTYGGGSPTSSAGGGLAGIVNAGGSSQNAYNSIKKAGESGTNKNLQPYTVTNYIIKATQTTPVQAEVVNTYSESQENAYSCDYINDMNTYSTTEIDTGKIWTDGKTIYRKVVDLGALPNNNQKSVAHNVSMDTPISCKAIAINSTTGVTFTVPMFNIEVWCDKNNVAISTTTDRSAFTGLAIIEYTKTN